MPQAANAPTPAVAIIFSIISIVLMGGMVVAYVIMLIAFWRGMKAHEKIAEKLSEIADKLPLK